jgi:2-polyprenyl-6-methoxyphenol hydroxylase-like FAD-dependent oxidoreductase
VRVEDGRLNLAAALDPGCVKKAGGVGELTRSIIAQSGFPAVPGLAELPWHGTPLLTRRHVRPAGERLLLLGDAAGYVEPFTGEGMTWALGCGRAAAPIACRGARRWDEGLERRWVRIYRGLITRRQWVVRGLGFLLRRPLLARAMVRTLMRVPIVATPVLRYLNAVPT